MKAFQTLYLHRHSKYLEKISTKIKNRGQQAKTMSASTLIPVIAAVIVIVSMIVSLFHMFQNSGSHHKKNPSHMPGGKIIANNGVNSKNGQYGSDSGDLFDPGYSGGGTIRSQDGHKRSMWHVRIQNLETGKCVDKTFHRKLFIGRCKPEKQLEGPFVAIPEDLMISGVHCSLAGTLEGLSIMDHNSTNHTYLNGKRVKDCAPLPSGGIIKIGSTSLQIDYKSI